MTPDSPLLQAFDRLVEQASRAPLVASPSRSVTVGQVAEISGHLGDLLDQAGLVPGRLVGLSSADAVGFLAALLAVRRAGLVGVVLDPDTPSSECDRIAAALGLSAFLRAGEHGRPDLGRLLPVPPGLPKRTLPGLGIVKLTSGSTGEPKGIAFRDDVLLRDDRQLATTMGLLPSDRLLATLPLSHSYGLSSLAVPALVRGTLLVTPAHGSPTSPLEAAERLGATVFPTVPVYLASLLRLSSPPRWPPSLRLVISAGAPLSPPVARAFRERFGQPAHVFYGASECGGICYDRDGGAAERGTVGTPVDGVRVTLGEEGEVIIESPAVAHGYVPVADPRLGDGRYRSDDLGAWEGQELALRGRRGDWINVDGRKVNPREVEAILGTMEGVEEVAVFPIPLPGRDGSGVAALLAGDARGRGYPEVVAWCRQRLPRHKIPRSIRWVERIPRGIRGKVDRRALAASLAAGR